MSKTNLPDEDEKEDIETLPISDEPEEDEVDETETEPEEAVEEETAEEVEESPDPEPQASTLDVDALRTQIIDDLATKLNPVLGDMYNRLRQSGKDTVRAETRKQLNAQKALLDKLVTEGRLTKEDARGLLTDLSFEAESAIDKAPADQSTAPGLPIKESKGQNTANSFQDACLAILDSQGVALTDPDAKELLTIQIPNTYSFKQAVKAYSDAVAKIKAARTAAKSAAPKKKATLVTTNNAGKRAPSTTDIVKELNELMRQSGGDFEKRMARNRRIRELNSKIK